MESLDLVVVDAGKYSPQPIGRRPGRRLNGSTYKFSDFPTDRDHFGVKPSELIQGHVIQSHLEKYTEHFWFAGRFTWTSASAARSIGPTTVSRVYGGGGNENDSVTQTKKLIPTTLIHLGAVPASLPFFSGQASFARRSSPAATCACTRTRSYSRRSELRCLAEPRGLGT